MTSISTIMKTDDIEVNINMQGSEMECLVSNGD